MISDADYQTWDAVDMAEGVRCREMTASELEAACRRRIAHVDPALNAIAELASEAIEAPASTGTAATGNAFRGVPFLVKELLAVPGLPWSMGSRLFREVPAMESSAYVDRLLAAGLRVVGSTTSSEFGLVGSTESALRGTTANPWRRGLTAGGSSGGAGAAVAAGIVPVAHASDGGGSIRWPAAVNGVFGLMPSRGRCVPATPDAGGLTSLVVDHCVSRTVRDSARMLAITERRDSDARYPTMGEITEASGRRLRIATWSRTLSGREPDEVVRDALGRSIGLLDELGHDVREIAPPTVDAGRLSEAFFTGAAFTMVGVVDMMTAMLGRAPGPDDLEPFTLELVDWGRSLPPTAADEAERALVACATDYLRVFDECDVVVTPTLPTTTWEVGTLSPTLDRGTLIARTEELIGYPPIHNPASTPAMSVPLEEADGLPIGMHFAAAPGDDAMLLHLAYELEASRPWAHRRPPLDRSPEATPPNPSASL